MKQNKKSRFRHDSSTLLSQSRVWSYLDESEGDHELSIFGLK